MLARDCVASIRRWAARDALGQALMQRTDELSAPDDRTVVFRLKRPFPLLPNALGKVASNMCAIMPERLASTDPFKQVTDMVGSGPFRFKADERVQGSRFVYERFAGYQPRGDGQSDWTAGPKAAHFDRVEWHVIPDPATAAAALQSGEVDWWEMPTADLLPLLRRNRQIKVALTDPTGICGFLRPNHLHPPFDNPAVRRALLGAIDQSEFAAAAMGTDPSLWRVPCGYFAPSSPLASDVGMAALTAKRDYAEVKQNLQAAGYKGEILPHRLPRGPRGRAQRHPRVLERAPGLTLLCRAERDGCTAPKRSAHLRAGAGAPSRLVLAEGVRKGRHAHSRGFAAPRNLRLANLGGSRDILPNGDAHHDETAASRAHRPAPQRRCAGSDADLGRCRGAKRLEGFHGR